MNEYVFYIFLVLCFGVIILLKRCDVIDNIFLFVFLICKFKLFFLLECELDESGRFGLVIVVFLVFIVRLGIYFEFKEYLWNENMMVLFFCFKFF